MTLLAATIVEGHLPKANEGRAEELADFLIKVVKEANRVFGPIDTGNLETLTGQSKDFLLLVIAFTPALILELVSSIGAYAVNRNTASKAPRTLSGWFAARGPHRANTAPTNEPTAAPAPQLGRTPSPQPPRTWKISP